jgi:hypothetical protein
MRFSTLLMATIGVVSSGCGDDTTDTGGDGGVVPGDDTDRDSITDVDEGARDETDTDGDGIPDFRDLDSDGDSIEDAIEAGDADPSTPPVDSDGDGTPDFRDLDSDDNGLLDADEGTGDADGDGIPDFADRDDDNDLLDDAREIIVPDSPPDTDGDGMVDFRDPDSDNDTILDGHEGEVDTDGDGLIDRYDLDSDNDTLLDAEEAGDADMRTAPVDTDGDSIPDFRDPDSDDDGLADDLEVAAGTDPRSADTDGDGVTDLIEHAAGTDPLDGTDSPRTRGDFVFEVPYMEPPDPLRDTLSFRTAIRLADLYFAFDTSTTMAQETAAMRDPVSGVPGIIDRLRCPETTTPCASDLDCGPGLVCDSGLVCVEDPNVSGCLLDMWTGVGRWNELDTYTNLVGLQPDPTVTAAGIPTAPDWWVAPIQPAACIADPTNCNNTTTINCAPSGIGCPGFRSSAVRIYIQITDAADECLCVGRSFPCSTVGAPAARCAMFTTAYAGAELASQGIRFIGLIGSGPDYGASTATDIAREIGIASGTVDATGEPFVYSATDAMVVDQTVAAVRDIVTGSNFEVTIDATDRPDDAGDALQFIERLEVNLTGTDCDSSLMSRDTDGDGFDDAFTDVRPRVRACWDVVVRPNTTVMPTREPLVFEALLTVRADGSPVDSRVVYFLVPPDVVILPVI